jgi:predicted nucleotidyltransferase
LAEYEKQGVLEREKTANSISYKLKETPFSLELKKTAFLAKITPFIAAFLEENPTVSKLALYGSHAKGSYDEKSDIDLLAISQEKKLALKPLRELEAKTGKEAKIQVFTITEWKKLLEKKDLFALAVLRNNVLLSGEPL